MQERGGRRAGASRWSPSQRGGAGAGGGADRALPVGAAAGRGTAGLPPTGEGKGPPRRRAPAAVCRSGQPLQPGCPAWERGKRSCLTVCDTGWGIFLPWGTYRGRAGRWHRTSAGWAYWAAGHGLRDRSPSLSQVGAKSEVLVVVWIGFLGLVWFVSLGVFPSLKKW